jgi:hypothetical protein
MQKALNEINYEVAELIDMRIDITQKTSEAMEHMQVSKKINSKISTR